MNKLSKRDFLHLTFLIFGIFFGAGNLIFPAYLGMQSGSNIFYSYFSFCLSAILFPMIGLYVSTTKNNQINKSLEDVSINFRKLYYIVVLLCIGPFLAIPRCAITPYEIGFSDINRFVYTFVFFAIVYYFSLNPSNAVTTISKYITPVLISLIILIFCIILFKNKPTMLEPIGAYTTPIKTGFLEGYNTMDTLASLTFGVIVTLFFNSKMISDSLYIKNITIKSSILSGILIAIIYGILTYMGLYSSNYISNVNNGADILKFIASDSLGNFGIVILSIIFVLACLSVSIGLTTSISKFFSQNHPIISYKKYLLLFTLLSFSLSNFGLNNILMYSIPILTLLYPVTLTLIIINLFETSKNINRYTLLTSLIFSILSVFKVKYFENTLLFIIPTIIVFIVFKIKDVKN